LIGGLNASPAAKNMDSKSPSAVRDDTPLMPVPSWVVGLCGVAAVASTLFSILLFLNR
jgi:hypothetical protein